MLKGPEATVKEVSKRMDECAWVHLTCHGFQNVAHLTESALLLDNGPLELTEITWKSLQNADFAFLSACQTAAGDQHWPDEAIHLAAGMLLAGYRGVIGTMWSIRDEDGPMIADAVYGKLLEDEPDSKKAAHALHYTVQQLRKRRGVDSFLSWVPFIHIGL